MLAYFAISHFRAFVIQKSENRESAKGRKRECLIEFAMKPDEPNKRRATCRQLVAVALAIVAATASFPSSRAEIIESVTEDITTARGQEAARSKGGPSHNTLSNTDSPVRAGKTAFKHWVSSRGERSELAIRRTEIGGTYWYGWSIFLPQDFDHRGSDTIVMQLASWPTPRNGRFPHSANGPYLEIQPDGRLIMHLQHPGEDTDMVCHDFVIADGISKLRAKWIDFVMHARWTGDRDGVFQLWIRSGDEQYVQKVD
jgi:hypothetical protein